MKVGVPKEAFPGERRVALVPAVLPSLTKAGFEVLIESGAGEAAGFTDPAYQEKGGRLVSRAEVFGAADLIAQVRAAGAAGDAASADLKMLRAGQIVVATAEPLGAPERLRDYAS